MRLANAFAGNLKIILFLTNPTAYRIAYLAHPDMPEAKRAAFLQRIEDMSATGSRWANSPQSQCLVKEIHKALNEARREKAEAREAAKRAKALAAE
jgi:hypothetical protein